MKSSKPRGCSRCDSLLETQRRVTVIRNFAAAVGTVAGLLGTNFGAAVAHASYRHATVRERPGTALDASGFGGFGFALVLGQSFFGRLTGASWLFAWL